MVDTDVRHRPENPETPFEGRELQRLRVAGISPYQPGAAEVTGPPLSEFCGRMGNLLALREQQEAEIQNKLEDLKAYLASNHCSMQIHSSPAFEGLLERTVEAAKAGATVQQIKVIYSEFIPLYQDQADAASSSHC